MSLFSIYRNRTYQLVFHVGRVFLYGALWIFENITINEIPFEYLFKRQVKWKLIYLPSLYPAIYLPHTEEETQTGKYKNREMQKRKKYRNREKRNSKIEK